MSHSLASVSSLYAASPPARPPAVQRLRSAFRQLLAEWRVQRDLRQLAELDSYILKDIGIGRGGLEDAVRHGRSRNMAGDQPVGPGPMLPPSLMPVSWTEWR